MTPALICTMLLATTAGSEIVSFDSFAEDGCSFTVEIGRPSWNMRLDRAYPIIDGMSVSFRQGEYMLPELYVCVPVPPGTMPRISFSTEGSQPVSSPSPYLVTPMPDGSGMEIEWVPGSVDDQPVPTDVVSLDTLRLAGTLIAAVRISPFAGSGLPVSIPSSVSVQLGWPATGGSRPIDSHLLRAVCDDSNRYWPIRRSPKGTSQFWGMPWARMAVAGTGIYVVTGQELEDSGIEITGSPSSTLRLMTGPALMFDIEDPEDSHQLTEIPIEVIDGGDGLFEAADTLKFFGLGLDRFGVVNQENPGAGDRISHRYATHNVYWLTWGGEEGIRMDTVSAIPDGSPQWGDSLDFRIWQEQDYFWLCGQEERTGWAWTQLLENMPSYFYFSTPSADGPGDVSISVMPSLGPGASSGPYELTAELNGTMILDTSWTSITETTLTIEGLQLSSSMNLLKVTATETPGNIYLDHVMVEYPRRLTYAANRILAFDGSSIGSYTFSLGGAGTSFDLIDVSDPLEPVRLGGQLTGELLQTSFDITGGRQLWLEDPDGYLKPDSILPADPGRIIGTGPEGDVAVVVADALWDAAEPLEAIYAARGLSAVLVKASEVYEEFGQGIRDPGAIRSFFRYTQDSWNQPARALLLVGDGNYDPMMHVTSRPTLIPVFLKLYSEDGRNMEDLFVMAHGSPGDDLLPEVPVSRISASTQTELAAYLTKVMTYDSGENPGEWQNRIVFAADDEWGNSTHEFYHTHDCDTLADVSTPPSFQRVKFFMVEYPWPPGTTSSSAHPEKPDANRDFLDILTQGCSSIIFVGHGSFGQLAHEKLLQSSDVQLIDNGYRQPVMIFASCKVAYFDLISANSLAEDFELAPAAGSIVSIGATRDTFGGNNMELFRRYYAQQYPVDDLSAADALWAAKIQLGTGPYTNSRYYVVLGDGGVFPVSPSPEDCSFHADGDSLYRGRMNEVSGSFRTCSASILDVTESGSHTTYYGFDGGSVEYLRYGSSVFRGLVSGQGTDFSTSFFMPLQADTGSLARGAALGISSSGCESAYDEWMTVADDGIHAADSTPPSVYMWLEGHQGEVSPSVSGSAVLRAVLSDSSGICAMSGGAGRSILLSLDDQGFDLSRYFIYRPDSYTVGELEYILPEMAEGEHTLIMAAWDGMGNTGRDTLSFNVIQAPDQLLSSVFVYPNPACGERCFNFQTSQQGTAELSLYTVAGRCIWRVSASCREGYNQVLWDGLDMDGDRPGQGAYIYRIKYVGTDGASAAVTDIMVISGE